MKKFDFDQWLVHKDFLGLKKLFIKHGAISTSTLQISSIEMQRLMADPKFLSQPQMVPKVVVAVHQLTISALLSGKEQAEIGDIKKSEYSKSQKQIENMTKERILSDSSKINETSLAFTARTEPKQNVLTQLNLQKSYRDSYESNDDDEKETLLPIKRKLFVDDNAESKKTKTKQNTVSLSKKIEDAQQEGIYVEKCEDYGLLQNIDCKKSIHRGVDTHDSRECCQERELQQQCTDHSPDSSAVSCSEASDSCYICDTPTCNQDCDICDKLICTACLEPSEVTEIAFRCEICEQMIRLLHDGCLMDGVMAPYQSEEYYGRDICISCYSKIDSNSKIDRRD